MTNQILFSTTLAFFATATGTIMAEEHIKTVHWSELKAAGQLEVGEVISAGRTVGAGTEGAGGKVVEEELLIVNDTGKPLTARLATLEPTGVRKHLYKVHGRVRYEGVTQSGHLESWNHFANGGPFFSKTLSSRGPMGKIQGSSPYREFILPFRSTPDAGPPTRLEINLVLPARGKVWISPLHVSEFEQHEWEAATTAAGAWWGIRTGAWMGAIFGPLFGILGAVVGTLSGRGRARNACLGICWLMLGFGVVCLCVGIVAVLQSQPYEVYSPLLLLGTIATGVMAVVLPQTRKRFAELELHRMEAMDASVAQQADS